MRKEGLIALEAVKASQDIANHYEAFRIGQDISWMWNRIEQAIDNQFTEAEKKLIIIAIDWCVKDFLYSSKERQDFEQLIKRLKYEWQIEASS